MGDVELLTMYERASDWTLARVRGAVEQMGTPTNCDPWDVRALLNHMLDTQRYFTGAARGEDVPPPAPTPPQLMGDDPLAAFEQSRSELLAAYRQPGALERTGPSLGIALADQLLHGWDLARSTGQDATMPEDLAAAAYGIIHGRFTDEQRPGVFKPEVPVGATSSAQEKLLGYTGRDPAA